MGKKKLNSQDSAESKKLVDKPKKKPKSKEDPKQAPLYKAYKNYMKSKEWKETREKILDFYGHKCMVCGRREGQMINGKEVKLTVHHFNYSLLGHEADSVENILNCCIVLDSGDHVFGAHRRANWNQYKMPDKLTPELEEFLEKYGEKEK